MPKSHQVLFVFFIVIVSFHFFDARFLSERYTNYFVFVYILSAITLSVPNLFRSRNGFILPIQLISFSIFISIFIARISWGQSFIESIIVTVPLLLWLFFFYLMRIQISVKTLELIILIYGGLYVLVFFFQLFNSQTVFFGGLEEFREERGVIRVAITGQGIFFLAAFISLNRLTSQKHRRWIWLMYSIFGLLLPILQATRQYIAGVVLIYLYHFIKKQSLIRKIIVLTSFFGFIIYFVNHSNNRIVNGLVEAQEQTSEDGHEYVRIISGSYFINKFSPDNLSKLFGNGVPNIRSSNYGTFVEDLKQIGIYMSDVGIIGFYSMFGILAVMAYILIWIKSFTLQLPEECFYPKYYIWFILLTSLTSAGTYHYSYLIANVFALYIYQTMYINKVGSATITSI